MKKGITKALAMFCATAMIVSVFSVSVFAGDEPHQGGLAAAVDAQDGQPVSVLQGERDTGQDIPDTYPIGEIGCADGYHNFVYLIRE